MTLRVRSASGADAAACAEIYRPYVLDTVISFETEPPTVEQMAARIGAAQVKHEWLVLEVDGERLSVMPMRSNSIRVPRINGRWRRAST